MRFQSSIYRPFLSFKEFMVAKYTYMVEMGSFIWEIPFCFILLISIYLYLLYVLELPQTFLWTRFSVEHYASFCDLGRSSLTHNYWWLCDMSMVFANDFCNKKVSAVEYILGICQGALLRSMLIDSFCFFFLFSLAFYHQDIFRQSNYV